MTYKPPLDLDYFGDEGLVKFRRQMRLWDKKLARLDPEMLVYVVSKANQLLDEVTEEL